MASFSLNNLIAVALSCGVDSFVYNPDEKDYTYEFKYVTHIEVI
jgi:hypothetical protein